MSTVALYNKLRDSPHFHFCSNRDCRLIYEDNCHEPETNHPCQVCRGTTRGLMLTRDPQECCLGNCLQVTDPNQLLRYSLGGPGPWFQCRTCIRSHGWPCTL